MTPNLFLISLGIVVVLIIICFVLTMINSSKINTLLEYSEDGDIIAGLKEYHEKIDDIARTVNKNSDAVLLSRLANCESSAAISFKKLGIMHYDAFDDVKGNMSFSVALLNDNNDGLIITSLYGHNSCNTYVREIEAGTTTVKILDEEKKALVKAINSLKKVDEDGSKQ